MSRSRTSQNTSIAYLFISILFVPILLLNDGCVWCVCGQMSVCDESVIPLVVDSDEIVEGTTIGLPYDVFTIELTQCLEGFASSLINFNVPTAYYSVTGNGGRIRASTCSDETDFNHRISVFVTNPDGDCSENDCLTTSIETDDGCSSSSDAVNIEWNTYNGWEYYVLIQNHISNTSGTFGLSADTIKPSNDQCRNAQNLEALTLINATQTTVGATQLTLDPCNEDATTNDLIYGVWYYVGEDPPLPGAGSETTKADDVSNSTLLVSICSQTVQLNVSIFTSSDTSSNGNGGSCGLLNCYPSSIQSTRFANTCESGIPTEVTWDAKSNEKYYIFVYSENQKDDGDSSFDGAAFDILFRRGDNITTDDILDLSDDKNDDGTAGTKSSGNTLDCGLLLTSIIGITICCILSRLRPF